MKDWTIYAIGFLAQLLFSSRLVIQWVASEKQQKVIAPTLFWILSLLASFLLFIYGYLRLDFSIMLGQSLTYYIYIRNLQLKKQWQRFPEIVQWFLLIVPILIGILYYSNNKIDFELLFRNENISTWLLTLGIVAQLIFTLRFIYQWLYAEHHKESLLPLGFWALSIIGAALILCYAIIRKDPVLFVGHLFGVTIYTRNIYLLKNQSIETPT